MAFGVDLVYKTIEKHVALDKRLSDLLREKSENDEYSIDLLSYTSTHAGWAAMARTSLSTDLYIFDYADGDDSCQFLIYEQKSATEVI